MAIRVSPQLQRAGVAEWRNATMGPGKGACLAYNGRGVVIPGLSLRGANSWTEKRLDVDMAMAHIDAAAGIFCMNQADGPDKAAIAREIDVPYFQSQTPKAFACLRDTLGSGSEKFGPAHFAHLGGLLKEQLLPVSEHDNSSPAPEILSILAFDKTPITFSRSGHTDAPVFTVFNSTLDRRLFESSVLALLQQGHYDIVQRLWPNAPFTLNKGVGAFLFVLFPWKEKGANSSDVAKLFGTIESPFMNETIFRNFAEKCWDPHKLFDTIVFDCVVGVGAPIKAEDIAELLGTQQMDEITRALEYLTYEGMIRTDGNGNYSVAD